MSTDSTSVLQRAGQATQASLLSIGQALALEAGLMVDGDPFTLSPDPLTGALPAPTANGWPVATVSAMVDVTFHADPRARTVYLVIDPDGAPYTGDFSVDLGTSIATFTAAADTLADVLTGWLAQIASVYSATVTAEAVTFRADGTEADAIQLRAVLGSAPWDTYATFGVLVNTIGPYSADLHVVREVESATLGVWVRPSVTVDASVLSTQSLDALQAAWKQPPGGAVGALGEEGYLQRMDVAGLGAVTLQLSAPDYGTDDVADVDTGSPNPRVTVVPSVLAAVYPAVLPS